MQTWSYWSKKIQKMGKWTKIDRKVVSLARWCWCCSQRCFKTFNTNHFSSFPFCGAHTKPHGVRGFIKHYHMQFYTELGHCIRAIHWILCACVECKSMLNKPWVGGFPPEQQPRYQSVTEFTYWPVIGSFNRFNIIKFSHKSTTS